MRQARRTADAQGRAAEFRVGRLEETDLGDDSVDAVMVVDAVQFADRPDAAYAELARVLRPGGRAVLTCWEVVDPADASQPERLRAVDMRGGLTQAGFVEVRSDERPEWRAAERALWEAAVALDPGGDPALVSFHDEGGGIRSPERHDARRRVLATATAP